MQPIDVLTITAAEMQGRVPVTVLYLDGRLNLGTCDQLEERARQAVAAGTDYLVLECSKLRSTTSAGLRAIHSIFKRMRAGETAHMKLANPSPDVARVLEIAGFDRFIDVYNDLQAAVDSF